MKRYVAIVAVLFLVVAVGVSLTQMQRPGAGTQGPGGLPGRGGFQAMRAVEDTWAAVTFELKVDDKTLAQLRPIFQKSWDKRKALLKDSAGDFQAIGTGMTEIKKELTEQIAKILDEKQMARLAELEQSQNTMPMRRQR